MKKALILDADLSYAFWLGRGLDHAGYEAFPARSVSDACALLDDLQIAVDLLIVNPGVPGAAEFIETVRGASDRVKVVAFSGDRRAATNGSAQVDVYCRRPDQGSEFQRQQWIERVGTLLPVNLLPGLGLRLAVPTRTQESPAVLSPEPSNHEAWRAWEGEVLGGRFPLHRHLGTGRRSAVYLTEYGQGAPQAAAIKVMRADSQDSHRLLSRWERAAELPPHPGLIRLFATGTGQLGDFPVQYVVMEYAEENLADVLRARALTEDEAREMLAPVLETLADIHQQGYVIGQLKPSNIMAVGERVKLASDGLRTAGETAEEDRSAGLYAAPESATGLVSPAADVWSLGVTLVESLTQQQPARPRLKFLKPTLPAKLPDLFLDIARDCLHPNPAQRDDAARIASRLRQPPSIRSNGVPRRSFSGWGYGVTMVVLGVALSAVLVRPRGHSEAAIRPVAPAIPQAPAPPAAPRGRQVLHQVVPEVSESARQTIRGAIKVGVRASVAPSGAVAEEALVSPGPSPYFDKLALQAARGWTFEPLATEARSHPEQWTLEFVFTREGASAYFEPSK